MLTISYFLKQYPSKICTLCFPWFSNRIPNAYQTPSNHPDGRSGTLITSNRHRRLALPETPAEEVREKNCEAIAEYL